MTTAIDTAETADEFAAPGLSDAQTIQVVPINRFRCWHFQGTDPRIHGITYGDIYLRSPVHDGGSRDASHQQIRRAALGQWCFPLQIDGGY